MKRRQLLINLGLATALAPVMIRPASAQSEQGGDGKAEDEAYLLFVQHADSVSLADGVLSLSGVGSQTLFFSDRPERITGHWDTAGFVADWSEGGKDSFEADPPNAALSLLDGDETQDVVMVLNSPRLDGDTLVYDVAVLEGPEAISGTAGALFIDTIGEPLTPLSIAGGRRRVRRRTRRRN